MKKYLLVLLGGALFLACTTKFKTSEEDTTTDGLDTATDGTDTGPDAQDVTPDGEDTQTEEDSPCPSGEILCGDLCIDPTTDRNNCGECGKTCTSMEDCVEGTCTCTEPYKRCGDECVDTSSNSEHCGECYHACADPLSCEEGMCKCPDGLMMCGEECVDTNTNPDHCGECNHSCNTSAGEVCNGSGNCTTECEPGYTLCPGDPDPPYCADLENERDNCGECGRSCGGTTTYCCDYDCRECCEEVHCAPRCRGTARACGVFIAQGPCESQLDCSWRADIGCRGFTPRCSSYLSATLCADCRCSWLIGCSGDHPECSSYMDDTTCNNCNCTWGNLDTGTCSGTPTPCNRFFLQSQCTGQSGCTWFSCTDYICQE